MSFPAPPDSTTADQSCASCGATAGEPCLNTVRGEPMRGFHWARIQADLDLIAARQAQSEHERDCLPGAR